MILGKNSKYFNAHFFYIKIVHKTLLECVQDKKKEGFFKLYCLGPKKAFFQIG